MKERKSLLLVIGGSIKFFLLNWCEVNEDVKLVYKDKILDITVKFLRPRKSIFKRPRSSR